jgi:hypothetical protein
LDFQQFGQIGMRTGGAESLHLAGCGVGADDYYWGGYGVTASVVTAV